MTNADVMAQILSEASGRPLTEVQHLVADLAAGFGGRTKMNVELTDAEANRLISDLRKELPGIRAWLVDGARMMQHEIDHGTKH